MTWQFRQIILSAEIFGHQKLFSARQKYVNNGQPYNATNDVRRTDVVGGRHTKRIVSKIDN